MTDLAEGARREKQERESGQPQASSGQEPRASGQEPRTVARHRKPAHADRPQVPFRARQPQAGESDHGTRDPAASPASPSAAATDPGNPIPAAPRPGAPGRGNAVPPWELPTSPPSGPPTRGSTRGGAVPPWEQPASPPSGPLPSAPPATQPTAPAGSRRAAAATPPPGPVSDGHTLTLIPAVPADGGGYPEVPDVTSPSGAILTAAPRHSHPPLTPPPTVTDAGLVLPVPPHDHEKYSYVKRRTWVLTLGAMATFPLLLFSQARLVMNYPGFWWYAPFLAFGVLFFMLPLITDGLSRGFNLAQHKHLVESWWPARYPTVDVFLPVCGEPVEVLRNTWTYVAIMSRHYKGRCVAYVLDDSGSKELKAMAREFGFAYATRPDRGWLKKSGNLLYGFDVSDGEYILLLDADFAPRHDMLDETLPYMEAHPDVGIVQTPQFFRILDQQSWVERGAGVVQELFYRSIQTARARKDGAICVGSCALYRRAALRDNEGMSLAEHSEDVRTGFDLQRLGWSLRYLPVVLSTGNCPDNVLAFLNQQYRWCSGTVALLGEKTFWRTKLAPYTRLCYISGFVYYMYTAMFTFVVPALSIAILLFVPDILRAANMLYLLPVLVYAGLIFPAWHKSPYRLEAWSVKLIAGWAHVFTYWDTLRGKPLGWKPSGSDAKRQDGRRRFWVGLVGWSLGASLLWTGLAFWRMLTMNPYNFIILFLLGLFEVLIVARVVIQPSGAGATP